LGYPARAGRHLKGVTAPWRALRGAGLAGGRGAPLTSALTAGPDVPAAVFDVDAAVHVALRLVVVVNQAAIQVEDEPISLPAAQDGAWRDGEEVKDPHETQRRPPEPSHHPLEEPRAWREGPGQRDQAA